MTDLTNAPVEVSVCKGIVYRYAEASYVGAKGRMVFTKELRPLVKKSCPGCDDCLPKLEGLRTAMSEFPEGAIVFPDNLHHGDTVTLLYVVDSRCQETGYVEEYHYRVQLKE